MARIFDCAVFSNLFAMLVIWCCQVISDDTLNYITAAPDISHIPGVRQVHSVFVRSHAHLKVEIASRPCLTRHSPHIAKV